MGYIAARCPACGGEIQLDDSKESGFCLHCGSKVILSEAIKQRIEVTGSIKIDHSDEIANCMLHAKHSYKSGNVVLAYKYIAQAIEYDFNCQEARALLKEIQEGPYALGKIQDAFHIKDRGTVITCIWGDTVVRVTDTVVIKDKNSECVLSTKVRGIEEPGRLLDSANYGDYVGVLLSTDRTDFIGMHISLSR